MPLLLLGLSRRLHPHRDASDSACRHCMDGGGSRGLRKAEAQNKSASEKYPRLREGNYYAAPSFGTFWLINAKREMKLIIGLASDWHALAATSSTWTWRGNAGAMQGEARKPTDQRFNDDGENDYDSSTASLKV